MDNRLQGAEIGSRSFHVQASNILTFKSDPPLGADQFVGEFKDGKKNGAGIEYAADGSITHQGIYENGNLVKNITVAS
jgi:hypothetical protein